MTLAYEVFAPFLAAEAASGNERKFQPGEIVLYDDEQREPTVTIEFEGSQFLLDSSTFEQCCKFKGQTVA
jgi:hypothetical protein